MDPATQKQPSLTSLLMLIMKLADTLDFKALAQHICEFCLEIPTVTGAFVLKGEIAASSLDFVTGVEVESSSRLLMRVEHGLREWLAGVKPPPDHMTGFPPPYAIGIKGESDAPPIHAYPDRANGADKHPLMVLCIVPDPAARSTPSQENLLLGARDLLRLGARSPKPKEDEEAIPAKKEAKPGKFRREELLTRSPLMEKIFKKLDRVVGINVPVLIMGETGTGKELVARAIHRSSPRSKRRFYAQNCGAISEGLLESELFGYTKGAFTGADRDKKGLFEIASGSTLFLDEIGEMRLEMQKKMLRVLQEGEILPIGATVPKSVDVRIVCATNRTLKEEVAEGRFREDLYYRLQVIQLTLPPLRKRPEDIPLLMDHFLVKVASRRGGQRKKLDQRDPRVLDAFLNYDWPGNIRELENAMTRLAHFSGDTINFEILAEDQQFINDIKQLENKPKPARPLDDVIEEVEMAEISNALQLTHGNRTHAADLLRVNRRSLLRRMKKYKEKYGFTG
ncbi:MAG: sigma 54-interacting transcriptional regulator [Planctomycetota bacterium]|nr:sigma 54-interacting transcriptional regulator [Planctomycetota bacterium]